METQLLDRLITGINIPNLEREFIHKPKSSFQIARINYEAVNELDF